LCLVGAACGSDAAGPGGGGSVDTVDSSVSTDEDSGSGADSPGSEAGGQDAHVSSGSDGGAPPASDAGTGADGSAPAVTGPFEGEGEPWTGTIPRATCGTDDKADQDIQGLTGDYHCNVQIIGQVDAPHFLSMAYYEDCAYVNGPDGTTVIHVDAAGKPTVTTTLTEIGFRSNWESMKASETSGLIAGYESNGSMLTVYDLKGDCKAPVLQSNLSLETVPLLGSIGHAGSWSPDGTIYYASSMYTKDVFAVDLTMPKEPKVITTDFECGAHDLFVGKNGTRGYFAVPDLTTQALGVGSFAVMDLTQVQARAPNAKGTEISQTTWEDGSTSQYPILVTYRGKDYLIINDELGSGTCDDPMKPQWGYTRIFDMSDEKMPKQISLIKTEAEDPKNCTAASENAGDSADFFGLGTHYCNVDRLDDPRLLSCGHFDAGVRVYDIRNPWRPKEVAYFDTPEVNVPSMQRIVPDRRELWVASQSGVFYVLKFTPGSAADQILAQ
jgi:hypothetical protein